MGILDNIRARIKMSIGDDEQLYELVAAELERGQISKGLWAKALAQSEFDDKRARAVYMQLRVLQITSNMPHIRKIFIEYTNVNDQLGVLTNIKDDLNKDKQTLLVRVRSHRIELELIRERVAQHKRLLGSIRFVYVISALSSLSIYMAVLCIVPAAYIPMQTELLILCGVTFGIFASLITGQVYVQRHPRVELIRALHNDLARIRSLSHALRYPLNKSDYDLHTSIITAENKISTLMKRKIDIESEMGDLLSHDAT